MPADDEKLMLRAAHGSQAAFTEIVNRYESRLIAYFLHNGGDRELAEDCAQEVFVRLYRHRERYGPAAKFSTFLYTIARNYWIDRIRSRRSTVVSASFDEAEKGGSLLDTLRTTEPSPMDHADNVEAADRLHHALRRLPEGQREVVLLGVIQELPYAEVSAILKIPIGTVKSRVHTAIQSLREILIPAEPRQVPAEPSQGDLSSSTRIAQPRRPSTP